MQSFCLNLTQIVLNIFIRMSIRVSAIKKSAKGGFALFAAVGLTAGLAACSEGGSDQAADTDTLKVVASTPIWGDIAKELTKGSDKDGGKKFEVVTIMENKDDDPHGYEASARDLAKIKGADIVAANGGGYDNWLTDNAGEAKIVSAMPLAEAHVHGDHDHGHDHGDDAHADEHDHGEEAHAEGDEHADEHAHEGEDAHGHEHEGEDAHDHGEDGHEGHDYGGENPHAWLDMDIVNAFADNLAKQINEIDSKFPDNADSVKEKTDDFTKRLAALPAKKVVLTESIAEGAIDDSSLKDVTPKSFAEAVNREAEPSAADVAATRALIKDKKVDILITNEQAQTPAAEQLVKAAKDAKIKIVNLNETPDQGDTYFDYVDNFITELEDA